MHTPLKFSIEGKIWKYPGPAGWYFVDIGDRESAQIKWLGDAKKVGWGYISVNAKIGKTKWETTLFPSKEGRYLIAIKAMVRKKENLDEGDTVKIDIQLA